MKNPLLITLMILLGLTLLAAMIGNFEKSGTKTLAMAIMGIAVAKFLLVAFEFMELKKAHGFWKYSTVFICLLIALIIGLFGI